MYAASKKVLIGVFGSKPDPTVPDALFDHVYAANAALVQTQQYSHCSKTSVLSGYVFSDKPACLSCWEQVRGCSADFVHVVNSNETPELAIEERVRRDIRGAEFDCVAAWHRIRLIVTVLGWKVALRIMNDGSLVSRAYEFSRIIRRSEPRSLRISTGVYALCYAITQRESLRPTYYLVGVGLEGGTGHFYDNEIVYPDFHLNADLKVLSELKKKLGHRLVVTDSNAKKALETTSSRFK